MASSNLPPFNPLPSSLLPSPTTQHHHQQQFSPLIFLLHSLFLIAMKNLLKTIPRKLSKLHKSSSISRSSDDPSFSSSSASSSDKQRESGVTTPTSVLPAHEIDWSGVENPGHHDFVQAFKLMDADGDGKITRDELEALLRRIGLGGGSEPLSEEEITMMLSEVDRDGDGCISLEEFSAIGSAFGPPACDDEMRHTFEFFDVDQDGKISAEELHNVFRSIVGDARCTLEDCRRMITSVDRKGDGFVCFEDFSRMMEQQLHR